MKDDLTVYILDSFAVLAFFQGEIGMAHVRKVLEGAQHNGCRVYLSIINLGEVLYIVEREKGLAKAQETLAAIRQLPLEILPVDEQAVFAAAHLKANHPIAYADAFAVTAAQASEGILITGDPEFKSVEDIVRIEWLVE